MTSRRDFLVKTGVALGVLAAPSLVKAEKQPKVCKGCYTYKAVSIVLNGFIVGRIKNLNGQKFPDNYCDFVPSGPMKAEIWPKEVKDSCELPTINLLVDGVDLSDDLRDKISLAFYEADSDPVGAIVVTRDVISTKALSHYGPVTVRLDVFQGQSHVSHDEYPGEILPYVLDTTHNTQCVDIVVHPKSWPIGADTW